MSELVPRDYYDPTPMRRSTARELARIHNQSLVSRAAIEAREQDAAFRVQQRIDYGYMLAGQTIGNATRLNHLVTQVSQGNPGLEVTLRGIEETVGFAAQTMIHQYVTRS